MSNSPPTPCLLLTGATGNVGGATLRALLRQAPGPSLRVAARDPARDRPLLHLAAADRVKVVPFDFMKPETVAPALRGVTGIYLAARLGLAAHVSPVLAELLGREPGTLRAFLARERACWLPWGGVVFLQRL